MCLFIETIRIENGRICNLDYHAARFNRTRAAFGKDSAPVACPIWSRHLLRKAFINAVWCTAKRLKR
ncbi:hypothetical protein JCM10003_3302 [Bacteroides pyogenes JCM 10003]|nr:hypothetical protein JCM10003_3302 [Bacteroides pyogenes JCM 10003]